VIVVVVGREDRDELDLLRRQIVEHRLRLARVDHGDMATVAQGPHVVVLEGAQGDDLDFFGHGGCAGRALE